MRSRLPIAVAPAHHETVVSYLNRLAALHGMSFTELWPQVSRPRAPGGTSRAVAADLLAAVTGHPEALLRWALVELRQPEPGWLAYRHEPQHGCPRCTARHPGGPVLQLLPHHRYVCTRHRIWIGPPDLLHLPYPTLDDLPEIVAAQRAHLRLLHRHGPAATFDAVLTAFLICGHRWDQDAHHPDDARLIWDDRAAELIPHGTEQTTFSTSRLFAAAYPEAVKVAALIGSLHWRRLAADGPDGQRRFTAEIGRRLGDPTYRPRVTADPIAHWIDQDCYQPPSLPKSTYRALRGYGGATTPKPNQHSIDRNRRSATWFARNRRAGRVILYHRHVGPVLFRDWSTPMDLFTDTVAASADTWTFRDAAQRLPDDDAGDLIDAEYLRPFPAPSDHLTAPSTRRPGHPARTTPTAERTADVRRGTPTHRQHEGRIAATAKVVDIVRLMTDPTMRPPLRLRALLQALHTGGVNWVLTGSTVLAVYGARLIPNDIDVTPDLDPANLQRLARVLRELDAVPAFLPDWPDGPDLATCEAWSPDPATEQNLDHLFVTQVGMVDIPPRLCGTYQQLITHATRVDIGGTPVTVCALSEVLTRLHGRTRAKDQARAGIYQQLADLPTDQTPPTGVAWLLDQLGEPAN